MNSSHYQLCIRPRPNAPDCLHGHLMDRLSRIPTRIAGEIGLLRYGKSEELCFDLELLIREGEGLERVSGDESAVIHQVSLSFPPEAIRELAAQIFALAFMIADWNRWEVYDPQLEQVLEKKKVFESLLARKGSQPPEPPA